MNGYPARLESPPVQSRLRRIRQPSLRLSSEVLGTYAEPEMVGLFHDDGIVLLISVFSFA